MFHNYIFAWKLTREPYIPSGWQPTLSDLSNGDQQEASMESIINTAVAESIKAHLEVFSKVIISWFVGETFSVLVDVVQFIMHYSLSWFIISTRVLQFYYVFNNKLYPTSRPPPSQLNIFLFRRTRHNTIKKLIRL